MVQSAYYCSVVVLKQVCKLFVSLPVVRRRLIPLPQRWAGSSNDSPLKDRMWWKLPCMTLHAG